MVNQLRRADVARTNPPAKSQAKKTTLRRCISAPLALAVAAMQVACAPSPDSVSAQYVSPTMYKDWNCTQLFEERMRLTKEVDRVSGLQRENAGADAAMMTVGLIIFWPALFGLAATKDRKNELGRLKGEYDAVDHSMKTQQCTAPPPPTTPTSTPSTPATPPPPAPALVAMDGTYKGQGKTDSWCQTPSMTVTFKGATATGQLSEVSDGAPTSSITGTVNDAGQVALEFKGTKADYITGPADAMIKNGVLLVDLRSKNTSGCTYQFELKKD